MDKFDLKTKCHCLSCFWEGTYEDLECTQFNRGEPQCPECNSDDIEETVTVYVDIDDVVRIEEERTFINHPRIQDIQFMRHGKDIEIPEEAINRWMETGLSNIDFVRCGEIRKWTPDVVIVPREMLEELRDWLSQPQTTGGSFPMETHRAESVGLEHIYSEIVDALEGGE